MTDLLTNLDPGSLLIGSVLGLALALAFYATVELFSKRRVL